MMTRKSKPVVKVSDELKKTLNDAIATEIAASIQNTWQNVQVIEVERGTSLKI